MKTQHITLMSCCTSVSGVFSRAQLSADIRLLSTHRADESVLSVHKLCGATVLHISTKQSFDCLFFFLTHRRESTSELLPAPAPRWLMGRLSPVCVPRGLAVLSPLISANGRSTQTRFCLFGLVLPKAEVFSKKWFICCLAQRRQTNWLFLVCSSCEKHSDDWFLHFLPGK